MHCVTAGGSAGVTTPALALSFASIPSAHIHMNIIFVMRMQLHSYERKVGFT